MTLDGQKKILIVIALVLAALISIFGLGTHFSKPGAYKKDMETLDNKKVAVLSLSAAAAATSLAITAIPDDVGTPIAEKLADFSGYFILILCILYAEKYLLVVVGSVCFKWMIPIALLLIGLALFFPKYEDRLKKIALRLIILAVAVFLIVPASVKLSNMIESVYKDSIEQTVNDANTSSEELNAATGEDTNSSAWNNFINTIKGGITGLVEKFKNLMNRMTDAIAVYLVTTCIIPIAVLFLFIAMIKLIFGVDIKMPEVKGSDVLKKIKHKRGI